MSLAAPAVPVTTAQITLPVPTNVPYSWVVISNLSGSLMQVQIAGQTSWLEPFAAMIYNAGSGHQNAVLTPCPGATVPGGTVQATWYTEGEEPSGTWPISLTADAVAAGFSSLAGQGIVGASGGLAVVAVAGIASTSQGAFPVLPGGSLNIQMWNWIMQPTAVGNLGFASGTAFLERAPIVFDAMGPQGYASARVAGIILPNNGSIRVGNNFDITASSFLLVSPHA